jgi:hypothetical protein
MKEEKALTAEVLAADKDPGNIEVWSDFESIQGEVFEGCDDEW